MSPNILLRYAAGWLALACLGACSSPSGHSSSFWRALTPYKVEVVQGNVITREQADQVKTGMSRAEVRNILGSPLLTDIFHEQRWDYLFSIRRQGAEANKQLTVTVLFDAQGRVSRFTGADLPSEQEFVASIATDHPGKPPVLELTPEQIAQLPTPAIAERDGDAKQPVVSQRSYPPLEAP